MEFLDPLCSFMRRIVGDTDGEIKVWRWGPTYEAAFQFSFDFPNLLVGSPVNRQIQLKKLREGMSLFAAVAWVDTEALLLLLRSNRCIPEEIWKGDVLDMDEMPTFVELRMSSSLYDPTSALSWVEDVLASICCSLGSHNTSDEFQAAWRKIELLAPTLKGINIPVRIQFDGCDDTRRCEALLRRAWGAIRDILDKDQIRWGWAPSIFGGAVSSCSRIDRYSSFLLDSIKNCTTSTTCREDSTKFLELLDEISGRVQFSQLQFTLRLNVQGADTVETTCRALTAFLNRDTCTNPSDQTCTANSIQVKSDVNFNWEIKAFCAALAATRSCQSIHILLNWYYSPGSTKRALQWQWLAYALFSKRARTRSSVRRIKLTDVYLSLGDAREIEKALVSDSPVPAISNVEQGEGAQDGREYHANMSAMVRVKTNRGNELATVESFDVLRGKRVCGVRIIGDDDGRSEWVEVLAPGVGLCELQRRSLDQCKRVTTTKEVPGISLEFEFAYSSEAAEGLPSLLQLVGSSLLSLRLTLRGYSTGVSTPVFDPTWIIVSCPNLVELSVTKRPISAKRFVLACENNDCRVRHLEAAFDDLSVVANALCDVSHPLSKHLQWWHSPDIRTDELESMQAMLTTNQSLEYLTVETGRYDYKTIRDGLAGYEREVRPKQLPTPCKLAFLSVFVVSSRNPPAFKKQTHGRVKPTQFLAPDVVSKIFAFAVGHTVRKVNVLQM